MEDLRGRLDDRPRRLRRRGQVLGGGAADRLPGRALRSDRRRRRLRRPRLGPARSSGATRRSSTQKINTVCCGWLSRGVALGEGKVYLGQLDGSLVALDQTTGKVAWQTQVGRWQQGYTITAAPLYYDGLVITGISGGEFSIRGRVQAYDAETGKEVWRFYTVPGPGEAGHDTWPADNDSWEHGGAPVWQTPAVDPELGLLYFSTGNASPDLDGSRRAGDNLFAASIVAVDAKTGEYRWHFQQVHHDIWDYDGPSPVVLFDAEIDGEDRKGLAQASKTGWLYLLDRETGEPLLTIEESRCRRMRSSGRPRRSRSRSYPHVLLARGHRRGRGRDPEARGSEPRRRRSEADGRSRDSIFTPVREDDHGDRPRPAGRRRTGSRRATTPRRSCCTSARMRSVSGYSSQAERAATGKRGAGRRPRQRLHHDRLRTQTGYLRARSTEHRQDRVAEALARVVLLGHGHDRRRARLRRPQRRRAPGVRRRERRARCGASRPAPARTRP